VDTGKEADMAKKFIDFEELKEKFDMDDAIAMLKPELPDLKRDAKKYKATCPIHGGEHGLVVTPSAGDYGKFNCFAQAKGGHDSIGLVAHVLGCRQYAAAQAITEHLGTGNSTSKSTSTSKGTVPPKQEAKGPKKLQPLAYLIHDHEAVQALGLDEETAEELGLGYAKKGMMRGRIAMPLYRGDELAGYIGWSPKDGTFKLPDNLATEVPEDEGKVVAFPNRA
jgi:DNA primase